MQKAEGILTEMELKKLGRKGTKNGLNMSYEGEMLKKMGIIK